MIINFPTPRDSDDDYPEDWDACYDGPELDLCPDATVYTLTETAFLLDMPVAETASHLRDGTVPGIQVDGEWLVWRPALMAWLNTLREDGDQR
ncbi:hypothetical protein [Actinokineospora sp. NPDC004072]